VKTMPYFLLFIVMAILSASKSEGQLLTEVKYISTADGSEQPAMFFVPDTKEAVPLLVALHTWSGDYKQNHHAKCAEWCINKGWAYIHPDFRGPNRRPEATGSDLVVKDIVSAVDYAKKMMRIDTTRIYLVGTSGGGYTALVMAGHHPEIWAGISAWVPISDLKAWYFECKRSGQKYFEDIVKSCGGAPGDNPRIDAEYQKRSPLTYLANARAVTLHINAGIRDGHDGSVPVSHSLRAFNTVAAPKDRLSESEIRFFVEEAAVPPHLSASLSDPTYGEKYPLFRRSSDRVTVTIFEGGHELIPGAAMNWLEKQRIK
jgi:dipeptidyl aminopeptidase/acylaminoacyl peptidase